MKETAELTNVKALLRIPPSSIQYHSEICLSQSCLNFEQLILIVPYRIERTRCVLRLSVCIVNHDIRSET